jgi:hypothetical protein
MPRDLKLSKVLEDVINLSQEHDSTNMEIVFIANENYEASLFESLSDKNVKTIKLNCAIYENFQSLKFGTDIEKLLSLPS